MDKTTVDDVQTGNTESDKIYSYNNVLTSGKDIEEIDDNLKVLTKLDLDTAYTSEKLVNLHVLLMHLLAWDNDLEAMAMSDSATSVEKALVFDLLSGILESELTEVERFIDALKEQIFDVFHKISSVREVKELFVIMEGKLHDSEESLKQSQEQVSDIKMQLAKLQRTLTYIKYGKSENDESMELAGNIPLQAISGKSRMPADLKQRHVLRMLEKSLSRELELEKKLSELVQNEEQLKLKLHYTEQVASRMEETSEVIWGRFLEADNSSEVLIGISRELLGKLQIVQFNLNGSLQREAEVKSKLEDCIEQIKAKDVLLQKLENSNAQNVKIVSEVLSLREKAKSLEEKLKTAEFELKIANSSKQESLEQLAETENAMESLKESLYEAETRAESAETKVKQLTDTNLELTEEINFLKESDDKNTKKVTSVENQLRELEIQLQISKASSGASQEQQNMLYSAIWDMETLIEELKSKVSKAESKTETAEEQCVVLSETNSELNKELSFLRERVGSLEASLRQAIHEKEKSAEEINVKNKLMMDMVLQLAAERERIQERLYSLMKENGLSREMVRNMGNKVDASAKDGNVKELQFPQNDCKVEAFAQSLQEDELTKDEHECDTEPETSASEESSTGSNVEAVGRVESIKRLIKAFTAALAVLLPLFVAYLLNKKDFFFGDDFHGG